MRKIQKILVGLFAGGVLLTGLGTGIALVEFSSLSYGGQKIIGEEHMITKTLEYELNEDRQELLLSGSYSYQLDQVTEVSEDSEVPDGVILYEVTYNENRVRPFLLVEEPEKYTNDKDAPVRLRLGVKYVGDSFGEFMENKDEVLNDLKQHVICSYDTRYVTKVLIKANPATMELVEDEIF